MDYTGKLYGKIDGRYIELPESSQDFEALADRNCALFFTLRKFVTGVEGVATIGEVLQTLRDMECTMTVWMRDHPYIATESDKKTIEATRKMLIAAGF